jgi:hypothetical protein
VPVAAGSGDDVSELLIVDLAGKALIIVHMGCKNNIRMRAARLDRRVQKLLHRRAAAMMRIGGKDWVMQANEQGLGTIVRAACFSSFTSHSF